MSLTQQLEERRADQKQKAREIIDRSIAAESHRKPVDVVKVDAALCELGETDRYLAERRKIIAEHDEIMARLNRFKHLESEREYKEIAPKLPTALAAMNAAITAYNALAEKLANLKCQCESNRQSLAKAESLRQENPHLFDD